MWKKNMSSEDAAQIIDRFLSDSSLYPQEWNDFVDTPQRDERVEPYRKRCYELDPLVNRPGDQDASAVGELKSIIEALRSGST
jgi:hypothetical protein